LMSGRPASDAIVSASAVTTMQLQIQSGSIADALLTSSFALRKLNTRACERVATLRRASTTIRPLAFPSPVLPPLRSAFFVKWRTTEATPASLSTSVTFFSTLEKSCGDIDCNVLPTGDEPQPTATRSNANHL